MLAVVCVAFGTASKRVKSYAALNDNDNFSGVTEDNLIFSVEKVGVDSDYIKEYNESADKKLSLDEYSNLIPLKRINMLLKTANM